MMKGIRDVIKERILVLDGAMGTMIQTYDLQEEDFRGKFHLFRGQMRGNNDVEHVDGRCYFCAAFRHLIDEFRKERRCDLIR